MDEDTYRKVIEEEPYLAGYFHWVRKGKDGRRGYWRRIPKTYKNRRLRPVGQLKSQLAFSEVAHGSFGKRGFDAEGVPIVASEVKKSTKGRRFRKPKWKETIEQLKESLREVGAVLEEKAVA